MSTVSARVHVYSDVVLKCMPSSTRVEYVPSPSRHEVGALDGDQAQPASSAILALLFTRNPGIPTAFSPQFIHRTNSQYACGTQHQRQPLDNNRSAMMP